MAQAPQPALIPTALTSVASVTNWISGLVAPDTTLNSAANPQIISLINSASRAMLARVSRSSFLAHQVNEVRTGFDTPTLMLRDWPVLGDLLSLTIEGRAISKQVNFGGSGWTVSDTWDGYVPGNPQSVSVAGDRFTKTPNSTAISYMAGYAVQGEVQTVPGSDGNVWPLGPQGRFAGDWKVLDAAGALMTPVPSGPALGQYVAPADAQSAYAFNVAQGQVSLYYSFIPSDIDYICAKWVGEWIAYQARPGERTRTLGGQQTVSYQLADMPEDVKAIMNQYNRVLTV